MANKLQKYIGIIKKDSEISKNNVMIFSEKNNSEGRSKHFPIYCTIS
jgi:hypothetical protein